MPPRKGHKNSNSKRSREPSPSSAGPVAAAAAQPIEDEYVCGICLDLVVNCCQTTCCGSLFCRECVEKVRSGPGKSACPSCRKALGAGSTVPDARSERIAKSIVRSCPYKGAGCEFRGDRDTLKEHVPGCPKRPKDAIIAELRKEVARLQSKGAEQAISSAILAAHVGQLSEDVRLWAAENDASCPPESIAAARQAVLDVYSKNIERCSQYNVGSFSPMASRSLRTVRIPKGSSEEFIFTAGTNEQTSRWKAVFAELQYNISFYIYKDPSCSYFPPEDTQLIFNFKLLHPRDVARDVPILLKDAVENFKNGVGFRSWMPENELEEYCVEGHFLFAVGPVLGHLRKGKSVNFAVLMAE